MECPDCNTALPEGARACPGCGTAVDATLQSPSMPARTPPQEGVPTERVQFPPPPQLDPPKDEDEAEPRRGLSTGTIVGIVLVCVLVPGGIFAGIGGYAMYQKQKRSQIQVSRMRARQGLEAIMARIVDLGPNEPQGCPPNLRMLVPKYLKVDGLKDAWGNRLRVRCEPRRACVYSVGKNGKDEKGGGDDLQQCSKPPPRY